MTREASINAQAKRNSLIPKRNSQVIIPFISARAQSGRLRGLTPLSQVKVEKKDKKF